MVEMGPAEYLLNKVYEFGQRKNVSLKTANKKHRFFIIIPCENWYK